MGNVSKSCTIDKNRKLIDTKPIPCHIKRWLKKIDPKLTKYHKNFIKNEYDSLERISTIQNGQQLDYELGIKSYEHQELIMDAIHQIKHEDIMEEKNGAFNLNKMRSGRSSPSISVESIQMSSTNDDTLGDATWICSECGKSNKIGTRDCKFCTKGTTKRNDKKNDKFQIQFQGDQQLVFNPVQIH